MTALTKDAHEHAVTRKLVTRKRREAYLARKRRRRRRRRKRKRKKEKKNETKNKTKNAPRQKQLQEKVIFIDNLS